jgi:multicomponent Na+:H+ antiporter subunit G
MNYIISYTLIIFGVILWFWGTIPILNRKHSIFYKLHTLTVSDTVGSTLIIIGLLIRNYQHWAILSIATVSLVLWNTFFSYLIATVTRKS